MYCRPWAASGLADRLSETFRNRWKGAERRHLKVGAPGVCKTGRLIGAEQAPLPLRLHPLRRRPTASVPHWRRCRRSPTLPRAHSKLNRPALDPVLQALLSARAALCVQLRRLLHTRQALRQEDAGPGVPHLCSRHNMHVARQGGSLFTCMKRSLTQRP